MRSVLRLQAHSKLQTGVPPAAAIQGLPGGSSCSRDVPGTWERTSQTKTAQPWLFNMAEALGGRSPAPQEGLPPLGRLPPRSRLTLTHLPPPSPSAQCRGARARRKLLLAFPQDEAHLPPSHLTLRDSGRLTRGLSTPFGTPSLPSPTGVWPRPGPLRGPIFQAERPRRSPSPRQHLSPRKAAVPKLNSCHPKRAGSSQALKVGVLMGQSL